MKLQEYTSTFTVCVIFVLIICLSYSSLLDKLGLGHAFGLKDIGKDLRSPAEMKNWLVPLREKLASTPYKENGSISKSFPHPRDSAEISSRSFQRQQTEDQKKSYFKSEETEKLEIPNTSVKVLSEELPSTPIIRGQKSGREGNEEDPMKNRFKSEGTETLEILNTSIEAPREGELPSIQDHERERGGNELSSTVAYKPLGISEIKNRNVSAEDKQTSKERSMVEIKEVMSNTTKTPSENNRVQDGLMKYVRERFRRRNEFLASACSRLAGQVEERVSNTLDDRLYYTPKYNLMVCVVAKVGSTTWKNNLFKILGQERIFVHTNNKEIRAETYLNASEVRSFMTGGRSGTKVFTVRHPLARLVSAYRDKFLDGAPQTKPWMDPFFSPLLHTLHKKPDQNGTMTVSFQEFLHYVVVQYKTHRRVNPHWRSFSRTCSPCTFSYDYILSTDTWEEDLSFLVSRLNITEVPVSNHLNIHSKTEKTETPSYFSYYEGSPSKLLNEVYHLFKMDFELFNYTLPQFLSERIKDS